MMAAGAAKTSAARAPARTASQSMLTTRSSRPADRAERARQAELPRIEDACRIKGLLQGDERVERGPERFCHEPRAVQSDTMVVAQSATGGEHRPLTHVPELGVVPVLVVSVDLACEREIDATAVDIA